MCLSKDKSRRLAYLGATVCLAVALLYFSLGTLLAALGGFLVINDNPTSSEAVVVLSTGIEYYPRLQEAARLFREGYAEKVVINGNRDGGAPGSGEERLHPLLSMVRKFPADPVSFGCAARPSSGHQRGGRL